VRKKAISKLLAGVSIVLVLALALPLMSGCATSHNPSISVDKTETSMGPYGLGDTITYSYTVTNNGDVTLTNVSLSDNKIDAITLTFPSTSGELAPGETATGTGQYTVTQSDADAGEVVNLATASGDDPDGVAHTYTDQETAVVQQKLAFSVDMIESSIGPYLVGDTIIYSYTVSNNGDVTMANVSLTDDRIGAITLDKTTLAASEEATGTGQYTVTQVDWAAGSIVSLATASAEAPNGVTHTDRDKEWAALGTYTIGITAIITHPALDANRQGFIDQMVEEGFIKRRNVKYIISNPEGDMTLAATIAQQFVSQNVDLILAIATPTAQACVSATEGTDIPVVFGSVTDPVAADLVDSWAEPGGNVTGISDWADVATQVQLIMDIVPTVKKLGVIYNAGEVNSVVQVDELKKAKSALGITEIVEATAASTTDVLAAAQSLVGRVDAIWVPTDNTVVAAFEAVVGVCEDNQIPLFAADTATVVRGAIGTPGLDYYQLGLECGEVAARILFGENPADIPIKRVDMTDLYLNPSAAERMGVTIPQSVLDRATQIVGE